MENNTATGSFQEKLLPLMTDSIPEKFLLQAKDELGETKEKIAEGLTILRECIRSEKLNLNSDKNFLLLFLRQAKFDFKRAKETLMRFPQVFELFGEYLVSSDLKRIEAVIEHELAVLLPFRDKEGRAIICVRAYNWPKDLFDMTDATVAIISLFMFASTFPLTSVCGINYLADAKVNSISDYLPIFNMFKVFLPYMNCIPYRIKRVDIVSTNFVVRCFVGFIRTIVPLKMFKRMFLHGGNFRVLKEAYTSSMLPRDLEGTLKPIDVEDFNKPIFDFLRSLKSQFENKSK